MAPLHIGTTDTKINYGVKSANPTSPSPTEGSEYWNKYKNKDYGEEFCHQCSKEWDTSFKKPICLSCFKS